MARLWSCGFELQSVINGVEADEFGSGKSISTATYRSGAASLRLNPSNNSSYCYKRICSATAKLYARFYFRFPTLPANDLTIFTFYSGSVSSAKVCLRTTGKLAIYNWKSDSTYVQLGSDSNDTLNTNTWYRIELYSNQQSSSFSEATLLVDGIQWCTGDANPGATCYNIGIYAKVEALAGGYTTFDCYYDDIAVNNTTGDIQNSYPGAGSIVHMYPDSAGDNAATAGTYADIDEVTPDDATSYIELDNNGDIGDYNMQTSASAGIGESDTITLVQVGIRDRAETAALESWRTRIKSQSGGTVLSSATTTHDDVTWKTNGDVAPIIYRLTSYVDPQAAGAWTSALLDTAQIGVIAIDAAPDIHVTTLWALVEYVYVPPVEGTNMQINIGDTFKAVSALKINIGDSWKPVTHAWINISNVWKSIF